ncbi:hypothetical protein RUM43_010523 [Polyplax serrata]|uniref:Dynamin GTPase n=1 Tax=Polyplax serrata TaxID=468196 RepID=A0AAN8P476_POLSC
MESLIPVVNKLQNVFNTVGSETLLLPQIVVVGTQSSGKSSVLESLVGKSFLPKGVGIITRQPLVLQLINIPQDEKTLVEEFGVFQHKKNVIFKDFEEIRTEIEAETKSKAGNNKGICEDPIFLSIYSKQVVNLTLIDLPGLTKVPVGNQPYDIEMRIRKLVLKYICNPNSIILAVITANTDMATSESLQMARECDPEGSRTVAVVTKLDLMDSGTDASDILSGRIIPVRLGIIGVVNRSQKDTVQNKPISSSIEDEAAYLQKHYPNICHRHGSRYLAKTLNKILIYHIRKCLPDLKQRIASIKAQTIATLGMYGDDVVDNSKTLLHAITKFCTAYCASLDGTSREIETSELSGGARICYIFHETFGKTLENIKPLIGLSKYDILTAMRNASGTRPALFVPEVCFETLVKKQISLLLEPSLKCVELIHEEMQQILQQAGNEIHQEMIRFPKLFEKILTIASDIIRKRIPQTIVMVENILSLELAYINTMHPEFTRGADLSYMLNSELPEPEVQGGRQGKKQICSISPQVPNTSQSKLNLQVSQGWFSSFLPSNQLTGKRDANGKTPYVIMNPPKPQESNASQPQVLSTPSGSNQTLNRRRFTERDNRECKVIEKLVTNYFGIVRKSVQDLVPKAIMYCLVNFVKDNIQRELVEVLYKSEKDENLLQEPENISIFREQQKFMLKSLEDAEGIINDIRDVLL